MTDRIYLSDDIFVQLANYGVLKIIHSYYEVYEYHDIEAMLDSMVYFGTYVTLSFPSVDPYTLRPIQGQRTVWKAIPKRKMCDLMLIDPDCPFSEEDKVYLKMVEL